ncbi:MAG: alginate export family protein [Candidatus Hydrogenedentes bacterium]|nr:alginate export family protein [Candidatus Hydrogenedentota bacterium]
MRLTLTVLLAVLMVGVAVPAFAELQNVEVGGSIRIRGNYFGAGASQLSFDDNDADSFSVEQRTLINVKADFTDDVTAFIELDSYNIFGDDFRGGPSDPFFLEGVDNDSETSIGLYQGYIEMREAWGYPLTIKMGRQEIQLGSEWLIGNNDTSSSFKGLSFDSVLARYDADQFSLTALWARLADNNSSRFEKDDDADLYSVYASYTGLEDMTIDAYWILARVANTDTLELFAAPLATEATEIHTFGLRFAGVYSQFDWDVEGAVQTGESGISGVDQDAFGATGEGGYTFDMEYQPRIFVKGSFYSGDDDDAPFNRLFSDHEDSEFLGNTDLTNYWSIGGGVSAQVTEKIELTGVGTYFQVDEEDDFQGIPLSGEDNLGFEIGLYATYNYSEDLYFEAGYAHFFADDAVQDAPGAFIAGNGTVAVGGSGQDDDLDYFYIETGISF